MKEKQEEIKTEEVKTEVEEKQETPTTEEVKTEVEEKQETNSDFEKSINDIKLMYETKIAKLNEENKKALSERDKVITQLLSGEGDEQPKANKIVDDINKRRTFKKW